MRNPADKGYTKSFPGKMASANFMHTTEVTGSLAAIPSSARSALLRFPPLSPAATMLYAVTGEDADMRQIASVISADPSLSSLVLRLVNSPLFGVRHSVTGILQAVAMLGLDRIRSLSTTAALRLLVKPAQSTPVLTRCWRHSVATALASQEIALKTDLNPDAAYTAGLLHDIGCFAMLSCWPKEYTQILNTCEPGDLLAQEVAILGLNHSDAGAFLLRHWGLPTVLVEAALEHHSAPIERQATLVDLALSGCRLADAIGFVLTAKAPEADDVRRTLSCLVSDDEDLYFRIADGINRLECLML
jgi:putative nucleotidyltransferase with HDIG domain